MKNTLAFLAAAVVVIAAVGWYLDWFKVQSSPSVIGGHQNVNIDINKDKIGNDLQKGKDKIIEKGGAKVQQVIEKTSKDETGKIIEDAEKAATPPTPRN